MAEEDQLNALWKNYLVDDSEESLYTYLQLFILEHANILKQAENFALDDVSLSELTLPDTLLHSLKKLLAPPTSQLSSALIESLHFIVKTLIIYSRTLDNIQLISSCDIDTHLLDIASSLVQQLKNSNENQRKVSSAFLHSTFLLFELLYDPYMIWRTQYANYDVDHSKFHLGSACVNPEMVPFLCDSLNFEDNQLFNPLQTHLLHLFGAIISGDQKNALNSLTATSLDSLFQLLTSPHLHKDSKRLTLHIVSKAIQVLKLANSEQRQVEMVAVLDGFAKVFLKLSSSTLKDSEWLDSISEVLVTCIMGEKEKTLRKVFHDIGYCASLLDLLQNIHNSPTLSNSILCATVRFLTLYIASGYRAKKHFEVIDGFNIIICFVSTQPAISKKLVQALFDMATENTSTGEKPLEIQNAQIVVSLISWLPTNLFITDLDLQLLVVEQLLQLLHSNFHSQINCCRVGMLGAIITCLQHESHLSGKTVRILLKILEIQMTTSVSSQELKQLFLLLRLSDEGKQFAYTLPIIYTLSKVAKKCSQQKAAFFFDFQNDHDGIAVHGIKKWPGLGFTFHCWLRLDPTDVCYSSIPTKRFYRRQLYSFLNSYGSGFEAFFTGQHHLVVATSTKKEFHAATIQDDVWNDGNWHCLDICHIPSRRPFTSSYTTIFIDGRQKLTAQIKFPPLTETFGHCRIGCAGQQSSLSNCTSPTDYAQNHSASGYMNYLGGMTLNQLSTLFDKEKLISLSPNMTLSGHLRHVLNATPDPAVHSCPLGTQEGSWGIPSGLRGQISTVCLFSDTLTANQIKALYASGPNNLNKFKNEEGSDTADLPGKLVFYYDAKAYSDGTCNDLSPHHLYNGMVTGTRAFQTQFHEVLNTIGGIQVLYPLLENSGKPMNQRASEFKDLSPESSCGVLDELVATEDWVMLPTSSYADWRLTQNQAGGVLLLVLHLCQYHVENQEQLLAKNGIATLGVLMQRVPSAFIDVNVLMAVQLMIESVASFDRSQELLTAIYQYLLFDFRIWSKGSFPLKIGHIQYISTIIKDNPKQFRKTYGIQFFLDILQIYYNNCDLLNFEDMKTIRVSLLGLVKFYLTKDVNHAEIWAIVSFLIAVKHEQMVMEMLDMLIMYLESGAVRDQFFLLIYEHGCGELLYGTLLNQEFCEHSKYKVLKIIVLILKTDKVYEKTKVRMRLHDIGFTCLTTLLNVKQLSPEFISLLMDLTLLTDTANGYQGALAILQFCHLSAEPPLKLELIKKVWTCIQQRPACLSLLAKQIGWQECILGVLVKQQIAAPISSFPASHDLMDFGSSDNELMINESPKAEVKENSVLRRKPSKKQRASLHSQHSFDEVSSLPRTPQILQHLKEHIFDFELPSIMNRSGSRGSSLEDITAALEDKLPTAITNWFPEKSGRLPSPITLMEEEDASEDPETQLCRLVCEIVYLIMWKGVEGSNKQAWADRNQAFAYINMLALRNELFKSHLEIRRTIAEKAIDTCILELQEVGQANASLTENSFELMRIVYDFVVLENTNDDRRLSNKLLEGVLGFLDVLLVFVDQPGEEGWAEMAEMGLAIVLVCAGGENLERCAMATAKLHALVQTRPSASLEESCHLLGTLDSILVRTIENNDQEHYSFLIPVIRALIEKLSTPLHLPRQLPALPYTSSGPAFFDEFQQYALSAEWKYFIRKVVKPLQQQYVSLKLDDQKEIMNNLWIHCYETNMVAMHKRNREVGESKLRFQSQIIEIFNKKVSEEMIRLQDVFATLKYQNVFVRRRWKVAKLYLTGPRGPWQSCVTQAQHWKLSHFENYYRMRLKMTLNHTFDNHLHASRLRDNQDAPFTSNVTKDNLPVAVAKEALVAELQEDALADEDLEPLYSGGNKLEEMAPVKDKSIISENCDLVTLMSVIKGRLEITMNTIYFFDLSPVGEERDRYDFKCSLSHLREIHLRRYNLRRSALEFFLVDQTNFFINFNIQKRNKIYGRILSLRPPNLIFTHGLRSPAELLKASGLTQKWVQREISNFEYLMHLNTMAGRTYNDLSQYPVFPWILADYVSPELDLENPQIYRNLSKPIGVVNPKNVEEVKSKYDNFVDLSGNIAKFHYGTHYSNSAGVLHYLVRIEPFTSLHVELQSGRFDVADRQFHSLEATWRMLMENPNDVKELIPEFFYLSEFLINENGFDLGRLQGTQDKVDHVKLPPWANSAEDFIYKHRKALESDYVSTQLHNWIDLIFGYKQKGPAAVEALNMFYYVSYEGAVDLDAIQNPVERDATEGMINNFGQTPSQLFKEPHVQRMSFQEALQKVHKSDTKPPNLFLFLDKLKAFFVEVSCCSSSIVFMMVPRTPARTFLQSPISPEPLFTISQSGQIGVHSWLPYDKARIVPNYFTFEKDPSFTNIKLAKKLGESFQPGLDVMSNLFAVTSDGRLVISGGHWDNSVRVYNVAKGRQVCQVIRHQDIITCVALDANCNHLITGSRDTTCMIWETNTQSSGIAFFGANPLQILYGHDAAVTCVAISYELDIAISGSKDGTVNMHTVRDGVFLRTLTPPCSTPQLISLVGVSELGFICLHTRSTSKDNMCYSLHVYTLNGKHLVLRDLPSSIQGLTVSGDYLVTGSIDGTLAVWEIFGLISRASISLHIPISCLTLTPGNTHILASLMDGKLIVIGISSNSNISHSS